MDLGGRTLTSAGGNDIFVAKFWRAAPAIHSVRDVPGDQGGFVNVARDASGCDNPGEHVITKYTVWRAIDAVLAPRGVTGFGNGRAPVANYLEQNHPNPMSASTSIVFGLNEAADVLKAGAVVETRKMVVAR